uniref:Thiosulfate sulfurtransferase GlpE n=1 Tax=Candidatus Methanogaster sp. ANME-2c ERB4 TaxID=2759911 RepID=A0A7G9Y5C7_9EURY|nr:thiosulfate sulfurtransferase GlpE [Methanosarcinales archaeon ANME-2c ERB4]QNO43033.1 thiosulfate sulfurtransferase GlpE [Methanosarcinales archaeon ANME-2c ERB4]QNO43211.1 thiosulfate sulfurtransferase GlpE [Methanosarcinales archaeon ANME-2c ERB4]QNO45259.1 thiosulfate sulfurtransferase GlpE [Methanosarcinales archaeon ANME-2c ERB4]QNO45536.1 thiosulfate sulfurtransferase GlpE [Methanosarcinales archaeon ANME-2c ERB4]
MKLNCSIDEIKRLAPQEVKELLDKATESEFQLLDVRQPREYESGHIPGAKLIPLGELEYRYGELDNGRGIVSYCRSGHRSMAASILLCDLGFENVCNLDGGIRKWDYEVVKGTTEDKLITGGEETFDVLIVALMLEKGALDFYTKAQKLVKDEKAAQVFERLVTMEDTHLQRLYMRYSQLLWEMKSLLGAADELPSLDQLKDELSTVYMEGGMRINEELVKIGDPEFMDDLEALEIGLEKEYAAYDFYTRVVDTVDDHKTRNLLHELAVEERGHIHLLLREIEGRDVSAGNDL